MAHCLVAVPFRYGPPCAYAGSLPLAALLHTHWPITTHCPCTIHCYMVFLPCLAVSSLRLPPLHRRRRLPSPHRIPPGGMPCLPTTTTPTLRTVHHFATFCLAPTHEGLFLRCPCLLLIHVMLTVLSFFLLPTNCARPNGDEAAFALGTPHRQPTILLTTPLSILTRPLWPLWRMRCLLSLALLCRRLTLLPMDSCLHTVHSGRLAPAPLPAPTNLRSQLTFPCPVSLTAASTVILMTYEVPTSFLHLSPWPPLPLPSLRLPLLRHLCRRGVLPHRPLILGRRYVLPLV